MNDSVLITQVLISNALNTANNLLGEDSEQFKLIKNVSEIVEKKIYKNLKAQEYYGASIKKLAFVHYNKKLILNAPLQFGSVSLVENSFNALVLMSRGCLDSLACTVNLIYGDSLKEVNVKPLDLEFLKTIHNEKIKQVFKEGIKVWLDIDEYRSLIIHRTAVLIIPSGRGLPSKEKNTIEYFAVVKKPSEFMTSINTNDAEKHLLKLNEKVDEIVKLTEKTFKNISEEFNAI